jgi:hypothetical protein
MQNREIKFRAWSGNPPMKYNVVQKVVINGQRVEVNGMKKIESSSATSTNTLTF